MKNNITTIILIIGFLLLIWTPAFFDVYSLRDAGIIMLCAVLGGYLGEKIGAKVTRKKK